MREGLECWLKHPGLDSDHVLTLDLPSEYSVTSPGSVTAETFFGRVCLHSAQDFPVLTNPPQVLSFLKSEYSDCQRSRIFSVSLIAPEKWVSGTVAGPFIAPSHTVPLLLSWYWDSEVSSKVTHLQISEGPTSVCMEQKASAFTLLKRSILKLYCCKSLRSRMTNSFWPWPIYLTGVVNGWITRLWDDISVSISFPCENGVRGS